MTPAIKTRDLTRHFGRLEAVEGLSFQVRTGSIFALIGPNGAGKTTTIKLLMNLIRPTRGSAVVLGTDVRRLGPLQFQRIGYVSENQQLPDWMTTTELLAWCRPFYPSWDDHLCRKLLADFGLPPSARLRTLSRGMRMKAALLSALAFRPELIVLDEPFGGLDPAVRDELVHGLLELAGEGGWTVFVSSHDIEEVERLADVIAFLDRGRLVFAEPVSSLLERIRLIEVVAPDGGPPEPPEPSTFPNWLLLGRAGRTLRFVDTDHASRGALERIATAYPKAEIRASPMSLREVFVVLVREGKVSSGRTSE